MKLIFLKVYLLFVWIWYQFKWGAWTPWGIARLNLTWSKYINTVMYEERKKLNFPHDPEYEDFAEQAFVEEGEMMLFNRLFSTKDHLRVIFAPFSCGNKYQYPLWRIFYWIFGVESD